MGDIYCGALASSDHLEHFGIKGMRWGVRRFQREDGSLTGAGLKRKRLNEHKNEAEKKRGSLKGAGHRILAKNFEINEKFYRKHGNRALASMNALEKNRQLKKAEKADADAEARRNSKVNNFKDKVKSTKSSGGKAREYAVRGAKVAGTVLVAYGVYKAAKAYKKWSNTPYYDSIGNYVNPKMSGSRSAKDLVRTAYTKATGKAHYDAIGNYVEGRKSENSRYKERSRNYDALGNYYNKKYWNDRYKKRAAEMAKKKRR